MAGSNVTVSATGFSHPPDRRPVQKRPGGEVTWHKVECHFPEEKCLAHPLKSGCSAPPKPEEQ